MLWYKADLETSQCHRVAVPTFRDILVCMGEFGGQGTVRTALYTEDMRNPTPSLMAGGKAFFAVTDTSKTCGIPQIDGGHPFPVTVTFIDKVEFHATKLNRVPEIAVTLQFGRKTLSPKETEQRASRENQDKVPNDREIGLPVQIQTLHFVFDGRGYKPSAGSSALASRIQSPYD